MMVDRHDDRQTDICNSRVAFATEKVHCNTYNELTEYLQSKNGHDLNIFKPQSNTNYLKYFVRRFVAKNCMFLTWMFFLWRENHESLWLNISDNVWTVQWDYCTKNIWPFCRKWLEIHVATLGAYCEQSGSCFEVSTASSRRECK